MNQKDKCSFLKWPGKEQRTVWLQKHKKYSGFNGSNFKFYFNLLIEISSNYILKFGISQKGSHYLIKSKLFRNRFKNIFFYRNYCAETFYFSFYKFFMQIYSAFIYFKVVLFNIVFHVYFFVSSSSLSVSNQQNKTSN